MAAVSQKKRCGQQSFNAFSTMNRFQPTAVLPKKSRKNKTRIIACDSPDQTRACNLHKMQFYSSSFSFVHHPLVSSLLADHNSPLYLGIECKKLFRLSRNNSHLNKPPNQPHRCQIKRDFLCIFFCHFFSTVSTTNASPLICMYLQKLAVEQHKNLFA